jgi:uncharacterized C2H2 Zn-finger protein
MSRTHQSRTEWLERQRASERPPEPEAPAKPAEARARPLHAKPQWSREFERLYLRCPLCGWVADVPGDRPHHLARVHGWLLRVTRERAGWEERE